MNTRSLEYFLKIVELKSFSRAAIVLGVNQPALSRSIRELEADLGVTLLYRDGRGVRLTEQGERFQQWAARLNDQVGQMRHDMRGMGAEGFSSATIGILPTLTRLLALPLTSNLRNLYPDAKLRLIEGSSGHILEWLTDGRLDLAVLHDSPAVRRLNPEPVLTQNLYLVSRDPLPPTTPFAAVDGMPLILSSRTHGNRRELETLAQREGVHLKVVVEIDSLSSLLQLVGAGHGYGILPALALQEDLTRLALHASLIVEPTIERQIVLALPVNRPPMPGAVELLRTVRNEIRRVHMAWTANRP